MFGFPDVSCEHSPHLDNNYSDMFTFSRQPPDGVNNIMDMLEVWDAWVQTIIFISWDAEYNIACHLTVSCDCDAAAAPARHHDDLIMSTHHILNTILSTDSHRQFWSRFGK